MDCETFLERVEETLGEHWVRPAPTTAGAQCAVDFFHPRTVERFGEGGIATAFNRSGVVWAPTGRRLAVQLRVPADHDDAVSAALSGAPIAHERSDRRVVPTPGGEPCTVVHYAIREADVTEDELAATLSAIAEALSI